MLCVGCKIAVWYGHPGGQKEYKERKKILILNFILWVSNKWFSSPFLILFYYIYIYIIVPYFFP